MLEVTGGERLTREQIAEFEERGFLALRGRLPHDLVTALLGVVRDLRQRHDAAADGLAWWDQFHEFGNAGGVSGVWERRNIVADDPLFADLVELPEILVPMCQLLGPGIALMGSHAMVRGRSELPPEEAAARPLGWHRDLGVSARDMQEPHPRLAVKAAIWLSPLTGPGEGAMQIVPGSHRLTGPPAIDATTGRPYGAIEVLGEPGDLFFFEQRTWHAGAPNLSPQPRICLFYGYGYRWLRPQDFRCVPDEVLAAAGPIRRQLLGGAVSQMGFHLPTPDDVPLRAWFDEHMHGPPHE
jgi:ectoine hydroxylase